MNRQHEPLYVGNICTSEYTIMQCKAAAENLPSVVEADASLISELRSENARLREVLQTIAQQPFGGEVIGYGKERNEAFRFGWNTALNRVYEVAQTALKETA